MNVEVRLFATLRNGRKKVQKMEVPENTTVSKILDLLQVNEADIAILLLNGRDGSFSKQLHEGDVLALFPPVGGG
jgi:molybdopterin synthase sulfur carrier subunit